MNICCCVSKLLTSGKISVFGTAVGDHSLHLVFNVDGMNARAVHDGERAVVDGVRGELAVWRNDVEPLGKEEVDLLHVLAQSEL